MKKPEKPSPIEKAKAKRARRALYHASKISDYQFKKVLWHFAIDDSVQETAKHVVLSENSIAAIFAKLRRFFFEHRLFRDPYHGRDPREGFALDGFKDIELLILRFHLERVSKKRGRLDAPLVGEDHHFGESNWRFDFEALLHERGAEAVRPMMYANLLEFVRRFGPIGKRKTPTLEEQENGFKLATVQLDRMTLWLERNSVKFREETVRKKLRHIRES